MQRLDSTGNSKSNIGKYFFDNQAHEKFGLPESEEYKSGIFKQNTNQDFQMAKISDPLTGGAKSDPKKEDIKCPAVCGDNKQEKPEECDGTDTVSGLTCTNECKVNCGESKYFDTNEKVCKPNPVCGNGVKEGAEICDDGNTNDGDQCSAECKNLCEDPQNWDGEKCSGECPFYQKWDGSNCVDIVIEPGVLASAKSKVTGIEINTNNDGEFAYFIDADSNMPDMNFIVTFQGGLNTDEQKALQIYTKDSFEWHLEVGYWDGTWPEKHLINSGVHRRRKGKNSGDYWEINRTTSYNLNISKADFANQGIYGGGTDGYVQAMVMIDKNQFFISKTLRVWGTEPTLEEKEKYMPKEIKAIYKYEARDGKQFEEAEPGHYDPVVSFDGGFGLTQLTECNGLPTLKEIWSWKENIDGGQRCFQSKLETQSSYLNSIIGEGNYTDEQLMRSAFQAYNGYNLYINYNGTLVQNPGCLTLSGGQWVSCWYGNEVYDEYRKL